jgi:hypothetical protein
MKNPDLTSSMRWTLKLLAKSPAGVHFVMPRLQSARALKKRGLAEHLGGDRYRITAAGRAAQSR